MNISGHKTLIFVLIADIFRTSSMNAMTQPTLLHIEDNADISLIVSRILSNIVTITHVTSLAEARQTLAEQDFDLALLDLTLPDGSGLDLVNELKQKKTPVPIIVHSAHEVSETIHDVDAVLSKMYTQHDDLREKVLELTGQTAAVAAQ